jgi:glucose-1-phosphate thymidylyltransferase
MKSLILKPSPHGELEITDVNMIYPEKRQLKAQVMSRGCAWLDTGTGDSLLEAGQSGETIERRQGFEIACLEEISWHSRWIDETALLRPAKAVSKNGYGQHLQHLVAEKSDELLSWQRAS